MEQGMFQTRSNGLWRLEEELTGLFKPVVPDPDFIGSLERRLSKPSGISMESKKWPTSYLFIAVGILTGTLLIWLLINRGLHHLPKTDL